MSSTPLPDVSVPPRSRTAAARAARAAGDPAALPQGREDPPAVHRRRDVHGLAWRLVVAVGTCTALGAVSVVSAGAALEAVDSLQAPGARLDDAGVLLAAGVGAVVAAWWALGAALTVAAVLLDGRGAAGRLVAGWARRTAPPVLRMGVAALLGAGTLALPAAASATSVPAAVTASAGSADSAGWADAAGPTDVVVPAAATADHVGGEPSPVSVPTEPTEPTGPAEAGAAPDVAWRPAAPPRRLAPADEASAALVAPAPSRPDRTARAEVVVRRGDTLWSIAARQLPAGAGAAEIAEAWPELYAANREVVGENPSLIRPGQRLLVPAEMAR